MTKQEVSERYQIPIDVLQEYESWGLCGVVKTVLGAWQYDEQDIKRLGMIMTLHDLEFTNEEAETYMRLYLEEKSPEQALLRMLNKKRGGMLEQIHFREAQLERLDYLRYEMQKDSKNQARLKTRRRL